MRVGTGDNMYEWIEDWVKTPDTECARTGWSHHGIVVSESDEVCSGHQDDPIIQIFDTDGKFLRSWPSYCGDATSHRLWIERLQAYLGCGQLGPQRRQWRYLSHG